MNSTLGEIMKLSLERLHKLLWVVFALMCLVSVYYHKQIYTDGAIWFISVVNHHQLAIDPPYVRYSSALIQLPTLLWSYLHGGHTSALYIFCFSYLVYPFLALWGMRSWLRKNDRLDLMAPLVQSFLLTIVPTWTFTNGVAPEAIVLSWFLLLYVWVTVQPKAWLVLLLGAFLLFSYESGFVYYLAAGWILARRKQLTFKMALVLGVLTAAQLSNLWWNILPANAHAHFRGSFWQSFNNLAFVLVLAFMLHSVLTTFKNTRLRFATTIVFGICCLWVGYSYGQESYENLWAMTYFSRVWCVPLSGLLFMLAFELQNKRDPLGIKLQGIALLLVFIPVLVLEGLFIHNSRQMKNKITSLTQTYDGCVSLDFNKHPPLYASSLRPNWTLPFISLALNVENIKTVLYHREGQGVHMGCNYESGGLRIFDYYKGGRFEIYLDGHLNLNKFRKD